MFLDFITLWNRLQENEPIMSISKRNGLWRKEIRNPACFLPCLSVCHVIQYRHFFILLTRSNKPTLYG